MGKYESKKKLPGPWRSLHAVVWLIGLYILFSRGWFFPGIFVLLAISAILEGFIRRTAPQAYEEKIPAFPPPATVPETRASAPDAAPAPVQDHRIDLLPQYCPSCNAPIRGHEVKWIGLQSANCPYCGTNLPMIKA